MSNRLIFQRIQCCMDGANTDLRDLIKDKVTDVVYYISEDKTADIFTKFLKMATFRKLRKLLEFFTLRERYGE